MEKKEQRSGSEEVGLGSIALPTRLSEAKPVIESGVE